MGQMSQALTEHQNKNLHGLASQMVLLQTRLQEISAEIARISRSEVEPLKERCHKAESEIVGLLRRVQEAQEGASRVPELERELKFAKERIEKLELRGVQVTEMHQQSMNQLANALHGSKPSLSLLRSSRYQGILPQIRSRRSTETSPGAPNLGPGSQRRNLGPGRSSELGKPSIGHPGRAKNPEGSMGRAKSAVYAGPEPV